MDQRRRKCLCKCLLAISLRNSPNRHFYRHCSRDFQEQFPLSSKGDNPSGSVYGNVYVQYSFGKMRIDTSMNTSVNTWRGVYRTVYGSVDCPYPQGIVYHCACHLASRPVAPCVNPSDGILARKTSSLYCNFLVLATGQFGRVV